ncbi:MAG: hypothetical protein FJ207_13650 [Gemmatimonadetes bacterium]|nr:hypothetical protein [Gemmatimonadota bacterium]
MSLMLLPSLLALTWAPQVPQVRLTLHAEIGSAAVNAEGAFGSVGDLAADSAGNVYVLDNLAGRVHAYSPSGALLRSFGRPGGGPDQLNRPIRLDVRDGMVAVLNPSGTSSSYTLDGELVGTQRMPFGAQRMTRIDERRHVAAVWGGIARERPRPIDALLFVEGGIADTVLTTPSADVLFRSSSGNAAIPTSLCRLVHFVVGDEAELWVASGVDGTLTEWTARSAGFTAGRSAQLAPSGAALPDSTRAQLMRQLPRQLDPQTGDLYLPPVLAAICGLERSTDGSLWVRLADAGGRERWQTIDRTTLRPTRELIAPEGVSLSAFSGTLAYGVRMGPTRDPYVLVYRVE